MVMVMAMTSMQVVVLLKLNNNSFTKNSIGPKV